MAKSRQQRNREAHERRRADPARHQLWLDQRAARLKRKLAEDPKFAARYRERHKAAAARKYKKIMASPETRAERRVHLDDDPAEIVAERRELLSELAEIFQHLEENREGPPTEFVQETRIRDMRIVTTPAKPGFVLGRASSAAL